MKDQIKGGLADNQPDSKYDKKQIQMGIKVEMEHVNDKDKAKEIAKDHLEEASDYYTRLKKMEEGFHKRAANPLYGSMDIMPELVRGNGKLQKTVDSILSCHAGTPKYVEVVDAIRKLVSTAQKHGVHSPQVKNVVKDVHDPFSKLEVLLKKSNIFKA